MMDDVEYFTRRADTELRMAEVATGPEAIRAHVQLAAYYRERAEPETASRPALPQP